MTTPSPPATLPAPPAVPSGGFSGTLVPADVQQRVISLVIENAAFAGSLTQLRTRAGQVVFAVASPDGAAWVGELERLPLMSLNDSAVTVGLAKLAGLLDVSTEMMDDATFNLTTVFTGLLKDSLSRQLDEGLLNGGGPPEPAGVIAAAPEAQGTDQLTAVLNARAAIADSGGAADSLAASGAWLADADNARDASGALLWPAGIANLTGLKAVTVPGLDPPLVYDSTRVFCVVNGDLSSVEMSRDFRFAYDAVTFRVKSRIAVALPDPDKAIRKLAVTGFGNGNGAGTGGGAASAPAPARAKAKAGA